MRRFLIHKYDSSVDVWDGTVGTVPPVGSDGKIHITKCSEWAAIAASSDTFSGKTVVLDKDLDFSRVCYFNNIGDYKEFPSKAKFSGAFDGRNHIINLGFVVGGMFWEVSTVRNIFVTASSVSNTPASISFSSPSFPTYAEKCWGAVAAYCYGSADNCHNLGVNFRADLQYDLNAIVWKVGGVIGYSNVSGGYYPHIFGCTNQASLYVNDYASSVLLGGIIGYSNIWTHSTVGLCWNSRPLTAYSAVSVADLYVGGIEGGESGTGPIRVCANTGNLIAGTGKMGGIMGSYGQYNESYDMLNCFNSGSLLAVSPSRNYPSDVGGIVPYGGGDAGWYCSQNVNIGNVNAGSSNSKAVDTQGWYGNPNPREYFYAPAGIVAATVHRTANQINNAEDLPLCTMIPVPQRAIINKPVEMTITIFPKLNKAKNLVITLTSPSGIVKTIVNEVKTAMVFPEAGTWKVSQPNVYLDPYDYYDIGWEKYFVEVQSS